MGADLSRVRFDAGRDHAGVVLQQGRVLLDADWNEQVAILDRRLRADAADLGSNGPVPGIAGVAVVPRTTPDGFRIALAGGVMTIGRGRMYVDGLLAENHGTGLQIFEPLLAESTGSADTPYLTQPYWPTPDPLPAGGTHLVYLDVWSREVTPLEAPDLVEPAVGVDTTTRVQTVWQVRVHAPDTPGIDCTTPDADIPDWSAVIAPSAGRLTTDTIPVTDADDPCALPPTGGYRGLENQTYRVEIHDGGAIGTATFKWSRDNGSVAAPVVEVVSATTIRPTSLGKDDVLRFSTGNWVEITDDVREFDQVAGELRKVEVHDEDGTMTFAPALPADLVMTPAQAAARHLRVRRWDQHGQIVSATGTKLDDLDAAGSLGAIAVPASGAVVLEYGLTVQLTCPGGVFRTGDHWIFPARTNGVPFDTMTLAPPLGIHHHYARLGVASFPGTVTDCRTLWPGECSCDGEGGCGDCTVCVTPESHASGALTIQDAINTVVPTGGTVCLAIGTYQVANGLTIADAASVTVRGQGPKTLLLARGPGITVERSTGITLQDFSIIGTRTSVVTADTTVLFTAQRLVVALVAAGDAPVAGITLSGAALQTTLRENVVVAPFGIRGGADESLLITADLEVSTNVLLCGSAGVFFEGRVAHTLRNLIAGNTVGLTSVAGLHALGVIAPVGSLTLADNWVTTSNAGIEVGPSGYVVRGNDVHGSVESTGAGIAVSDAGLFTAVRGATRIVDNQVRGLGGTGVAVNAAVADLVITENIVADTQQGIVMDRKAESNGIVVSDNIVRDVGARESENGTVAGIQVVRAARADVESNTVVGVGAARTARDGAVGIAVLGCADSRVAGNCVDAVGFEQDPGRGIGIAVVGLARTEVHGNSSRRSDADVDEDPTSDWTGLLIGPAFGGQVSHETIGSFAAVSTGAQQYLVGGGAAFAAAVDVRAETVTVSDNIVTGGGVAPAIRAAVRGAIALATNQAQQRRETEVPAVLVQADAGTFATNVAKGGRPSVRLLIDPKRVAVLGNLTATGIEVSGAALSAPWDALNPSGVV
jgi:hypothetical protein